MKKPCIHNENDFSIKKVVKEFQEKNSSEVCFYYTSDYKSAKKMRDLVTALCLNLKIDEKWKSRLTLIVDEMNNNAIEYGSVQGETNKMLFKIEKNTSRSCITIEVEDTGNGNKAKKAKDMEKLRTEHLTEDFSQHNSIRGRGLFLIISQLVDKLYFKDSEKGGLIVGVKKQL